MPNLISLNKRAANTTAKNPTLGHLFFLKYPRANKIAQAAMYKTKPAGFLFKTDVRRILPEKIKVANARNSIFCGKTIFKIRKIKIGRFTKKSNSKAKSF